MLKSYLKIAYRNLLKNKIFSFINILGLAIGMAAFLLIFQYIRYELSYEDFHKQSENIVRVTIDLYNGEEVVDTDAGSYGAVGPTLKDRLPEVLDFARIYPVSTAEVAVDDRRFYEHGLYYADATFPSIFTLQAVEGNLATALTEPFQTVITDSIARKYFRRTDVVGESLDINNQPYRISAVIRNIPPSTHLKFDALLSRPTLNSVKPWYIEQPWNASNEYTYLLLAPKTNLAIFNQKLTELSLSLKEHFTDERLVAQPVRDIHLYSHKMFELEANGDAETIYFLLIIDIFILVIAWINYVNLSTARAVERAREVGIRKVLGSGKRLLIQQFVLEAVLTNALAIVVAVTFVQLCMPFFHTLTGLPAAHILTDWVFWSICGVLLVVGIILSGTYPAFVLSSFQPVTVLKGKLRTASHGYHLQKGLVVFQFAATVVLITGMLGVYLQIDHLRNQNLGLDLEQKLVVQAPVLEGVSDSTYQATIDNIRTVLLREPNVRGFTRSWSVPGVGLNESRDGIRPLGQDEQEGSYTHYILGIDTQYIPTFGMEILAGRAFSEGGFHRNEVIINEEALEKLGFESPEQALGERLTYYTRSGNEHPTVIGVVKNFSHRSPKEPDLPTILEYSTYANYLTLDLSTKEVQTTSQSVEKIWRQLLPESPLSYFFLNDRYNQQYQADVQFGQVATLFAVLAILVACLGLFGLSSFTILQRTKEIGVRKVLGASLTEIVKLLSKSFIKLVLIACLLAYPLSYLSLQKWLLQYATRIELGWWMFLTPLGIILGITFLTISFQTIKAALANPADSLRYE
ncbi:MAG: ABC transporter permease [Bacteroidota bacterium]